ncbi:hypothetical protein R3W88_013106 [Solanum pinnatisectum]|uniref:Uncharacterized protein n=1 Tax=Solanum pinnatisectum TaxID=50273 RepID=A0AAV9LBH4_9SOLN|nr:hypothetical protein R3W88_013106 [Solanum pinnatisectum]
MRYHKGSNIQPTIENGTEIEFFSLLFQPLLLPCYCRINILWPSLRSLREKAQYMVFSNHFENEEENKVFYDELELDLEEGKMEVVVKGCLEREDGSGCSRSVWRVLLLQKLITHLVEYNHTLFNICSNIS